MSPTTTIPQTDLDPYTDASITDPYPLYSALRDAAPVVYLTSHQVHCAARYDEVYTALHQHGTFVSGEGVGLTDTLNKAQKGSSFTSDPPYHAYVRGLVARHLKPRAMADITGYVTSWADRLVRELVERQSFDAVQDFAVAFPLAVVPDLLGWPEDEGKERLLEWASAGFNAFGPMNERTQAGLPLLGEMSQFLHRMSQPGNLRPGSWGAELVSEAREGKIEDKLLPGLLGDFLAPSMDTSVSALSSMMWLLGTHQDQWQRLKEDPSLVSSAFNEIIRFESPLRGFTRYVAEDTELGGAPLARGSRVLLLFGSANRDERFWKDPETFDIARPGVAQQVGFGHGIHACVGQALSRLEGQSLLEALIRHVDRIEVGEPAWRLHNTIRGIEKMDVTLHGRTS
ncbi:cytochrome P450 [Streptomyces sp. NPDC057705]|uniref:cytochrome P450 n=1 Tax=Streptomyces sp. NPDC057705 TaxID=3346222 RepID=UPI0036886DC4